MQQILKVFIVLAFIVAVIASPVPIQKRQTPPPCSTDSTASEQSDAFPVTSDPGSPDEFID
ncbi:hypothetical protein C1645_879046 [Glomus cerebriforme]|uniref:Secreted protein n=1 Tax=Glomus cerebriforme TaxID=658196 RepID=A0A397SMJ4_9GLOM|nr:hypothetical protein C1645_879046 [Glomus cerebriforme]